LRRADADLADIALEAAGDDPVAYLERPFGEQDQAGHEVVDDVLQAKTDTDGERTGDQRKAGEIDTRGRQADQAGDQDTGVADRCADGIAYARVDTSARHHLAVQPALEGAGGEVADHEYDDAGDDADQREGDRANPDLVGEVIGPRTDVAPAEAPLQEDQRQADRQHHDVDHHRQGETDLILG